MTYSVLVFLLKCLQHHQIVEQDNVYNLIRLCVCVKYENADCSKQSYSASFSGHSLLQFLRWRGKAWEIW